jgi:uncharacterized protein (DUF433 family)
MAHRHQQTPHLLGIGSYSVTEAGRLLRMPTATISRWLRGYSYRQDGETRAMAPLWHPQHPIADDGHLELGFRDLIELRIVYAFIGHGLGLRLIRSCLELARESVGDARPFSTRRFRTDGKTIFLHSIQQAAEPTSATPAGREELLDLKRQQYVIGPIIESSFRDLDLEDDIVSRWRPLAGKASIIIDPQRAFGQPIAAECGVPTIVLVDAMTAEGSAKRVASLYGAAPREIRDAMRFESQLSAA